VNIQWSDSLHVAVIIGTILVYVNDLMVFPSSEDWMTTLRATIRTTFDIIDEGVWTWILGMGVDYDSGGNITLQQHKYITDMLTEFNMIDSNPSLLPWSPGAEFTFHDYDDARSLDIPYISLAGSLLWTAVCTRPDISAAVSCLCRYVSRSKTCHWTAAKRVMRYLKGSSFTGIVFRHYLEPIECSAFVDSTWGSDPASAASVNGQIVCLGPVGLLTHPPLVRLQFLGVLPFRQLSPNPPARLNILLWLPSVKKSVLSASCSPTWVCICPAPHLRFATIK
jgi:hypothetical protein